MTHPPRIHDLDAFTVALTAIVGDRCSRSESDRAQHGRGETHLPPASPDLVVYPGTTDEVQRIVRVCAAHDAPIIAYGAGSSLEGHVAAVQGGISLDMTRMNRILRTSVEDMDATVEAGVTRLQLCRALSGTGATFFIDPGADATLGGMTSTGASGTTSVRYGTMRENVLGLTVVLADGSVLRTGGRARKSSAGYDLTRLFIGAEGTLGILTEVTVRLHAVPDAIAAVACAFPTVDAAVDAVVALLQSGVPLARIELLDELTVGAVNAFSHLGLPDAPMVLLELHAFSAPAIAEQLETVREIVAQVEGHIHAEATTEEARARLWEARHKVYFAGLAMKPGARSWTTDVCVPVSHLAVNIREARADCLANGIVAPLVGHVGDGNFHLLLLVDPGDAAGLERASAVNDRIVQRAIASGGTCTGEHGIGMGKMASLAKQHGDLLPAMRAIKGALDPHDLMNPGKILGGQAVRQAGRRAGGQ
ncbi:MAG: FAD-binding protein [Cytophagaceae bacterium]|nr:FAD-binding protein [Gemmatimonadaceae bacterium]